VAQGQRQQRGGASGDRMTNTGEAMAAKQQRDDSDNLAA
jgi:hypothetical protein